MGRIEYTNSRYWQPLNQNNVTVIGDDVDVFLIVLCTFPNVYFTEREKENLSRRSIRQ